MITNKQRSVEVEKIKSCLTSVLHIIANKLLEKKIINRLELHQLLEEKYLGEIYLSFIESFKYNCIEHEEIEVSVTLKFISEVIEGFSCIIEGSFLLKKAANRIETSTPIPHYLYIREINNSEENY